MPGERVRQDAAEQNAGGAAAGEDEADDAHRLRPLGRLGEQDHDQRERDHRHDCAAEALDGPRRDEELLGGRQPARERGEGEEGDPTEEQPPVPEEVAQPAAEQEKAAEREEVCVHDPGERGLGEAEVGPDRRQRDVHDRRVEHDHEIAQTEDVEREPAAAAVQAHRAPRLETQVIPLANEGGRLLIPQLPFTAGTVEVNAVDLCPHCVRESGA